MGLKVNVAGIILAAGGSTRMGSLKQLLPFQETTLIGRVAESARVSMLDPVIVVAGCEAYRVAEEMRGAGVYLRVNPDWMHGQSTSLKKGLRAVPEDCGAAMFLLADQPLVSPGIINWLISIYSHSDALIVIPTFQERRGNPVIVDRTLFSEVLSLEGDIGARSLFHRHAESVLEVAVYDRAVLLDADTRKEYRDLIQYASGL